MTSDDWYRTRPKAVDIPALLQRSPRHANCDLTIHRSAKNNSFVGMYCCQHDHWFTWVNPTQTYYLEQLGVSNPDQCPSSQCEQDLWEQHTAARSGRPGMRLDDLPLVKFG